MTKRRHHLSEKRQEKDRKRWQDMMLKRIEKAPAAPVSEKTILIRPKGVDWITLNRRTRSGSPFGFAFISLVISLIVYFSQI